MKAYELHEYLKSKGTWVNWNNTSDTFLFGDPEIEVEGIAVGWKATIPSLEEAIDLNCNLFITHEPLYAAVANKFGIYSVGGRLLEKNDAWVQKGNLLKENNMTVYRCHDVWDDFPKIGIHSAWAKWLGFDKTPTKTIKWYEVHEFEATTLGELSHKILNHVKSLGQHGVLIIGDENKLVSKIALGTGAITDYRLMHYQLGADVLVLTDDGTRLWESAQWSEDTGIPLIIVNHATAEEPGMRTLANYIQEIYPDIPVHSIKRGCLYQIIT